MNGEFGSIGQKQDDGSEETPARVETESELTSGTGVVDRVGRQVGAGCLQDVGIHNSVLARRMVDVHPAIVIRFLANGILRVSRGRGEQCMT
jgi:hypothetical protein